MEDFDTKYGWDKTNPNEWMITSNQIWNDNELSMDEKMEYQTKLVKMYYARKGEVKKALTGVKTKLFSNIRNAIGYSRTESDSRVKKELIRLKDKSAATWKAIEKRAGMNKKEILNSFDIEN